MTFVVAVLWFGKNSSGMSCQCDTCENVCSVREWKAQNVTDSSTQTFPQVEGNKRGTRQTGWTLCPDAHTTCRLMLCCQ